MSKQKILIICGPTATGKTALALRIANVFKTELISADSRQIYQGMDIGTGKDIPPGFVRRLTSINHQSIPVYQNQQTAIWGYDFVQPHHPFSVSEYYNIATLIINDIASRGVLPIVVGGTGLYLNSLIKPFATQDVPVDKELRNILEKIPLSKLQQTLAREHEQKWNAMNHSDRHNPRRLIRAIEVARFGRNNIPQSSPYEALVIGLYLPMTKLDTAIKQRVLSRAGEPFSQEIQSLIDNDPQFLTYPSASATGYREWWLYHKKQLTKDQAITLWQIRELQYAKRQITWFKKQSNIHWYMADEPNLINLVVARVKSWYAT